MNHDEYCYEREDKILSCFPPEPPSAPKSRAEEIIDLMIVVYPTCK